MASIDKETLSNLYNLSLTNEDVRKTLVDMRKELEDLGSPQRIHTPKPQFKPDWEPNINPAKWSKDYRKEQQEHILDKYDKQIKGYLKEEWSREGYQEPYTKSLDEVNIAKLIKDGPEQTYIKLNAKEVIETKQAREKNMEDLDQTAERAVDAIQAKKADKQYLDQISAGVQADKEDQKAVNHHQQNLTKDFQVLKEDLSTYPEPEIDPNSQKEEFIRQAIDILQEVGERPYEPDPSDDLNKEPDLE
ncbi:MAG: hypothetical protein WBA74_01505 [Cyclobacteriaceae bacterium]